MWYQECHSCKGEITAKQYNIAWDPSVSNQKKNYHLGVVNFFADAYPKIKPRNVEYKLLFHLWDRDWDQTFCSRCDCSTNNIQVCVSLKHNLHDVECIVFWSKMLQVFRIYAVAGLEYLCTTPKDTKPHNPGHF